MSFPRRKISPSEPRLPCSERPRRSCDSVPIGHTSSSAWRWRPPDGGRTTMSDRGMPSRFESDVSPPAELFSRVRAAVATTPISKTPTRAHIAVALAVTPLATAGVLGIASQGYPRPAFRVAMGTRPTFEFFLVLLFVIVLTLSATLVAFRRGELGLGAGALALSLVALLVAPIYATFTVMMPLETSADAVAVVAALSPWGLR